MAPQVPAIEPLEFPAGDTVQWRIERSDYPPADGWQLTYAFRGERGDGALDLFGIPDSQGYLVTITATESQDLAPGIYVWEAYMTQLGMRHRVGRGATKVTPNLASTNFSADLRSDAKKAFDNAMAAWQQVKLGKSVSLNGRLYTQHNIEDLILYVDRCKNDWYLEQQAQVAEGSEHPAGGDPRNIYVRFSRDT